ncbi:hypothetical protein ACVIHC_005242 [Bradyrhizobium diazoefficiens]
MKLAAASHQMYQIRPNPIAVAKPARMIPVPVLLGMWIGLNPMSGRW